MIKYIRLCPTLRDVIYTSLTGEIYHIPLSVSSLIIGVAVPVYIDSFLFIYFVS